jgi:hypothetical protein
VVDIRKLNEVTQPNAYPLPLQSDIIRDDPAAAENSSLVGGFGGWLRSGPEGSYEILGTSLFPLFVSGGVSGVVSSLGDVGPGGENNRC